MPRSGVTVSPRPSTRALPPARKNGTSEPSRAATRSRSWMVSDAPHASSAPSRAAAASRRAPGQPGRDRDPLLQPGGEGRRRSGRAGPAGADGLAGRRRSPGGRGCRRRAPASKPATWRVSADPAAVARLSRSASPRVTITEWSSWKPSGRRPITARLRFSLAGASRTTGSTRRAGSGGSEPGARRPSSSLIGRPIGGRAGRDRAARGPRAGGSTRRPPASAVDGPGRSRPPRAPSSTWAGVSGSCRARTLWSIFRRSRKPAWTSRQSSSSVAGSSRSSAG